MWSRSVPLSRIPEWLFKNWPHSCQQSNRGKIWRVDWTIMYGFHKLWKSLQQVGIKLLYRKYLNNVMFADDVAFNFSYERIYGWTAMGDAAITHTKQTSRANWKKQIQQLHIPNHEIKVEDEVIKCVHEYFTWQKIKCKSRSLKWFKRIVGMEWRAFGRQHNGMISNLSLPLMAKVYD